jgi:dTMP kinase
MSGEAAPAGGLGRFVTFEGIEGAGKSTQITRVSKSLSERDIGHIVTREPGGTPLGEEIRDLVLRARGEAVPDVAELLLMFAARAVHLANLIEPTLAAGQWVLCDRFTDATYAYQGAGRGVAVDCIRQLETLVQGRRRPDLTLLLDLPMQAGLERARQRNAGREREEDRFEGERAEFFERVRASYLARAAAEPRRMVIIDARQPADDVTAQITAVLRARKWIS